MMRQSKGFVLTIVTCYVVWHGSVALVLAKILFQ